MRVYTSITLRYTNTIESIMPLIFTDGMEMKTSGPYRIIEETDGLYVVGNGLLCAVDTRAEGEKMISDLLEADRRTSTTH